MKTTGCTILCFTVLSLPSTFGQQPVPAMPTLPPGMELPRPPRAAGTPLPEQPGLTKFNLDFPGGTPRELVEAIEKAMGRPLNAIVPKELADTSLPALKMNGVDVSQLFQALGAASRKAELLTGPGHMPGGSTYVSACGFRQGADGRTSDDTIWYFYADKPTPPPPTQAPPKTCRFYSLAPYLDLGVSVDDITTAIETGWKMLGETSPLRSSFHKETKLMISFHKETKLLIAVGEPSKLETIDAVLKALGSQKPKPFAPAPAPTAKPTESPKTEK